MREIGIARRGCAASGVEHLLDGPQALGMIPDADKANGIDEGEDGDARCFLVVADGSEKIGQGDGGELGEAGAFFAAALGAGMHQIEGWLVEQDQDGLSLQQIGPLLLGRC